MQLKHLIPKHYRAPLRSFFRYGQIYVLPWIWPGLQMVAAVSIAQGRESIEGINDFRIHAQPETHRLSNPRLCRFLRRQTLVPHYNNTFESEPVFTCCIENARFEPNCGILASVRDEIFIDSAKDYLRLYRGVPQFGAQRRRPRRRVRGTASSILGPFFTHFYHWTLEALPRLYSLSLIDEEIRLLMPNHLPKYQKETLELLLPNNLFVDYYKDTDWIEVERFVFPSYTTTHHNFTFPPLPYLEFVRTNLFRGLGIVRGDNAKQRIYISRSTANTRRVLNESRVMDLLGSQGFKSYCLEKMDFKSQVELFCGADAIVAPHGAGMLNMIYSSAPVPVLEFATGISTPCYFFLANRIGHHYDYLYPAGTDEEASSPRMDFTSNYRQLRDRDISIDIDKLKERLDSMGLR